MLIPGKVGLGSDRRPRGAAGRVAVLIRRSTVGHPSHESPPASRWPSGAPHV